MSSGSSRRGSGTGREDEASGSRRNSGSARGREDPSPPRRGSGSGSGAGGEGSYPPPDRRISGTRESGRGGPLPPERRGSRESARVNPYPPPGRRNSGREEASSSGAGGSRGGALPPPGPSPAPPPAPQPRMPEVGESSRAGGSGERAPPERTSSGTRESGRGGPHPPERRGSRESARVNPYPPPDRRNLARDGANSSGTRDLGRGEASSSGAGGSRGRALPPGGEPPEPLSERWELRGIRMPAVVEGPGNSPPGSPMAAGNPAGSPAGEDVLVDLPENEQYMKMQIRGGLSFVDMKEDEMRSLSCYYKGFFNHILPTLRVEQYKLPRLELVTNYFELRSMIPKVFVHKVDWDPDAVANRHGHPIWRLKTFWHFDDAAKAKWTAQGYESKQGLGVWDRGNKFFRTEAIDSKTMQTNFHTEAVFPMQPHWFYKERLPLTLNIVATDSLPDADEFSPVVWEDQALYRRVGFPDYGRVRRVRDTVADIMQAYHLLNYAKYVEDSRTSRVFFPSGWPADDDPLARFVIRPDRDPVHRSYVLRRGSRSTCRVLASGVFINVSTTTSTFWGGGLTVSDAIIMAAKAAGFNWNGERPLYYPELKAVERNLKFVRTTSVLCKIPLKERMTIPWRFYKIYGLSMEPCGTLRVPLLENARVAPNGRQAQEKVDFFTLLETYYGTDNFEGKLIHEPETFFPAVKVHPKLDWYLPPWVLIVREKDKFPMKRPGLSKFASATLQKQRHNDGASALFNDITRLMHDRRHNDPYFTLFQMDVNPALHRVPGYQLEKPILLASRVLGRDDDGDRVVYEPAAVGKGRWSLEPGQTFYRCPRNLTNVLVFCMMPLTDRSVRNFFRELEASARTDLNIRTYDRFFQSCQNDPVVFVPDNERSELFATRLNREVEIFRRYYNAKPSMVFLIVKDKHDLYDTFKFELDWKHGIQSQCVSFKNFADARDKGKVYSRLARDLDNLPFNKLSTRRKLRNIMLSINRKLGGVNVALRSKWVAKVEPTFQLKGTMIIGLDVTHPSGGLKHSIAGMVATCDMPPRTYATRMRVQEPKTELVYDIDVMVEDLVKTYIAQNPQKTLENILLFRDGVGDVDYLDVIKSEIPKLLEGIERAGVRPKPKLLFVVCAKRHHTRFMDVATNEDVPPGTAVNDLHFPHQQNFFLATHISVNKGAAVDTPTGGNLHSTHYTVLLDEVGMSLNELQTLIYHMAHTYEISDYSLAMPPPAVYAHWVCTRAKLYYQEINKARYYQSARRYWQDRPFPAVRGAQAERPWAADTLVDLTPHESIRNTMFYL